jgi:transcriptional regulator with XRE-family HTH domain
MVREKRSKAARELIRHVGARISACRLAAGEAPDALAECARIAPRTLARIEAGAREPDVGQLLALARALDVDVAVFFEGLSKRAGRVPGGAISLEHVREAEALVAAFQRIPDPDQRRRIVSLLKACVDSGSY